MSRSPMLSPAVSSRRTERRARPQRIRRCSHPPCSESMRGALPGSRCRSRSRVRTLSRGRMPPRVCAQRRTRLPNRSRIWRDGSCRRTSPRRGRGTRCCSRSLSESSSVFRSQRPCRTCDRGSRCRRSLRISARTCRRRRRRSRSGSIPGTRAHRNRSM